MTEQGPPRTLFATRALVLTTSFATRFRETEVGETAPRRVRVQEVDVETTGGGKQARSSIILVPVAEKGTRGGSLVCGWIDIGRGLVTMRSYGTLNALFKSRSDLFFDLPPESYDLFLGQVRDFVAQNSYRFAVVNDLGDKRKVVDTKDPYGTISPDLRPASPDPPPVDATPVSQAAVAESAPADPAGTAAPSDPAAAVVPTEPPPASPAGSSPLAAAPPAVEAPPQASVSEPAPAADRVLFKPSNSVGRSSADRAQDRPKPVSAGQSRPTKSSGMGFTLLAILVIAICAIIAINLAFC